MKAQAHPEYPHEEARLRHMLVALDARMDELAQANLITAYENAREALLMQYRAEYRALRNVAGSPYFARIDFIPYDHEEAETHYIGKKGFEQGDDAVVDWRAPLAALFYKGKPGQVDYASPAGAIRGRMQLKRNIEAKDRQLVTIADDFDIRTDQPEAATVEPGEFLREKLATRRDPHLQEIIATIQAHQYDLIQAPARQALVIQGVAGSGKTSIALHRLAYLLHPGNAEGVEAKRCIIFGPNRLFLSYIAVVLPELNIDLVTQTTFVDWACQQLNIDPRRVTDRALEALLSPEARPQTKAVVFRRSQVRNSREMGRLLERYVAHRRRLAVPGGGLNYHGVGRLKLSVNLPLSTIAEIHARFAELPLVPHRAKFVETLRAAAARAYDDAVAARLDQMAGGNPEHAAQVGELRDQAAQLQRLAILARSLEDARLKSQDTAHLLEQGATGLAHLVEHYQRQADIALSRVKRTREEVYADAEWRKALDAIHAELARQIDRFWPAFNAVGDYFALLSNTQLLAELSEGLFAPDEVALLRESQAGDNLDLSDLPAIHFLYTLAEGVTPQYDHVVIDEAQDTSRLQFETARRFSRNGSLTILGDLPQSIYAHRGIAQWDEVRDAFDGYPYGYHEIAISYRATHEITTLANVVLKSLARLRVARSRDGAGLAEPFARHAEPPTLRRLHDAGDLPAAVADGVHSARAQGYENIAVITKSVDAAVSLAVPLYDHLDALEVIETAEVDYHGGLVILPVHLAKGMEFEAAIVADAGAATYTDDEYDGRLLYVAVTRALHALYVLWVGDASPHLREAVEG